VSQSFPLAKFDIRKETLQEAVDAIALLDKGNPMAEKCAKYASKLVQILEALRKDPTHLVSIRLLIGDTEPAGGNGVDIPAPDHAQEGVWEQGQTPFSFYSGGQNALGFDMSELMVSGDLDFLTHFSNRGFY